MSVIVPFWLVRAMVPWKETFQVLPAILVSGLSFAVTQFVWSNLHRVRASSTSSCGRRLPDVDGRLPETLEAKSLWRYPEETEAAASAAVSRRETSWPGCLPRALCLRRRLGVMRTQEKLAIDKRPWGEHQDPVRGLDKKVVRVPPSNPSRAGSRRLRAQVVLRDGHGVLFACGRHVAPAGAQRPCVRAKLRVDVPAHGHPLLAIIPTHSPTSRATAATDCDPRPCLHPHRRPLSFLRDLPRLAWAWRSPAATRPRTPCSESLQRITSNQLKIDPVLMCAANSAGGRDGQDGGRPVDRFVAATAGEFERPGRAILLVRCSGTRSRSPRSSASSSWPTPTSSLTWSAHGIKLLVE